ncbi:MAG: phosphate ABC transporter substrate-binding protein [Armatimonadota bacterium]
MKAYRISLGLIVSAAVMGLLSLSGCPQGQPTDQSVVTDIPVEAPDAAMPSSEGGTIEQVGSTTILPIATAWAKAYKQVNPNVQVNVAGGGSGTGIAQLIDGTADIADASRAIKPEEKDKAAAAGVNPVELTIAYDGIAAIVHPDNPITELSIEQLSDIYSGRTTRWADLGVEGMGEIIVVGRDASSGTYGSWEEMVVQAPDDTREYAPEMQQMQSNEAVKAEVARNEAAIGYIGLGYVDESVKVVPVVPSGGGEAVIPTRETVFDQSYPVSRALYVYTNGEPQGIIKDYLDWCMGPEGQKIVEEEGFVPAK